MITTILAVIGGAVCAVGIVAAVLFLVLSALKPGDVP